MKKTILFSLFIFALILSTARAEDLGININPSDIWVGDSVTISCWYSNVNLTLNKPYAFVEQINQHILWTKNDFIKQNDTYFYTTFTPHLLGSYKVVCSNGTVNSSEASFKMSRLSFVITNSPDVIYLGDKIIVHANVIKTADTDEMITNNVNFNVLLNDKSVQTDNDATYSLGTEWIITTKEISSTDFNPSNYTLKINAIYMGENNSSTKNIQIKNPVEFGLIDMDKKEVLPGDNITITLKSMEKGSPIPLQNLQLKFQISDKQCTILSTTQTGNNLAVIISAPSLSPGSYNMSIKIIHDDYIWEYNSITIDYGVPINVDMKDSSDKAVSVQFRFLIDGVEKKKFITGSDGSFSGYITPGTYDIELTTSNSKLTLYDVMINSFDSPIKFDSPSSDVNIPGIGVGNIYIFEVALSYSSAYLELKYDSSKILNEDDITIYKCENWNFGRKICTGDWKTVNAVTDTIRDFVKINTSSLSAFLIGYKKEMNLNFDTDKDEYYLSDVIKVNGIVEDEDNKPVSDVQITAIIPGTDISASGKTDNSGVFVFELIGPNQEGDYNIIVKGEKSPFSSVNASKVTKIVRSSKLSLLVPESVKINQGENYSMWFSIVNIGQIDFSDLKLSLSGIPEDYYTLPEINELKAGEEKKISIDFKIPENAIKASHTGKLRVNYNNTYLEEQFILTVLSVENNESVSSKNTGGFKFPSLSLPTAKIILPTMNTEFLFIPILTVFIFSFAVLFKKKRITVESERNNVKNLLLDIKREVERPLVKVNKTDLLKDRMKKFRKTLKKRKTK
jgi:archaellum component FlaF (FlaF/FlaG flagellin family)